MIIHQKSPENQWGHYPESGQFHNTIMEVLEDTIRWHMLPAEMAAYATWFTIPHSFLLPYTFPINHHVSQGQTGNESAQSCLNLCECERETKGNEQDAGMMVVSNIDVKTS